MCFHISEGNEESEDKKHDWKDEKKESMDIDIKTEEVDKSLNDSDYKTDEKLATEDAGKEGNTSVTEKESKMTGKKSEARHAESRYAEVPMSHMFCHICNKHMWDGYVCIVS